jgi:Domain of unknown function (DUF1338)
MILEKLLLDVVGEASAAALFAMLRVPPALMGNMGEVKRAHLAQAMNMALFHDLLLRVPSGRAYVEQTLKSGGRVTFDHGALRTVAWPQSGSLPAGRMALARVLEPLGFAVAAVYPLPRLKMTGYAYRHQDLPEDIAQYFVSELHPEEFSPSFQEAVTRVVSTSVDPLSAQEKDLFVALSSGQNPSMADAVAIVKAAVRCFGRHHAEPALADYEILKAESAEMAWISTEGNAFNHATDRVADVFATAEAERAAGRAIKEKVEVSASGRVRQTALIADKVTRGFVEANGRRVELVVPGSFYEFISRDLLPGTDALDLAFDTGNATGIFNVTAAQS